MDAHPHTSCGAVGLLELLETGSVDDAGDDLAHVEGHADVHRRDAEQLLGRIQRLVGRAGGAGAEARPVQVGHDAAGHVDGLGLVPGQVVAQTRDLGVHARPAQLLLVGLLSDGHLDERRPAQEDAGAVLDHHRVVAHAGEVGASGGRGTEHDADGGDALGRELGQPAELLAPGHEDVGLAGQVGPSGLHQEQKGRRFSSATSMARRSLRIVVGLVVPPRTVGSLAMTRHCVWATSASATTTPPPTGSPVCSPASGHSSSTGVPGSDQRLEALAHQHFAAGPVALHVLRTAAREETVVQGAHLVDQRAPWRRRSLGTRRR